MLEHPNLVPVQVSSEADGPRYVLTEKVEGTTLEQLVKTRPAFLPLHVVLAWIERLGAALEYLHTHDPPVLALTVKPSNVLLDACGRVRLVLDPKGAATPGYAAIEQFSGAPDERADVYALGATLYWLLTRVVPPHAVLRCTMETPLLVPSGVNPAVPPVLDAVVIKLMALQKQDRPASAAEARQALQEVARPIVADAPLGASCEQCHAALLPMATRCAECDHAVPVDAAAVPTDEMPEPASPQPRSRLGQVGLAGVALIALCVLLAVTLKPPTVAVRIEAMPPGTEIVVDDASLGIAPQTVMLSAGEHSLVLKSRGYSSRIEHIQVRPDVDNHFTWTLKRKSGRAW